MWSKSSFLNFKAHCSFIIFYCVFMFLLWNELIEVFVGTWIPMFCRWINLCNLENYNWFSLIVLELDPWLIALNSWLFCLFLHEIVVFILLSFTRAWDDMIFCALFIPTIAKHECTMLIFLSYFVLCSFAKTMMVVVA